MKRILSTSLVAGVLAAAGMPASAGERMQEETVDVSVSVSTNNDAVLLEAGHKDLGINVTGSITVQDDEGGEIVIKLADGECICMINGEKIDPDEIETNMDDGVLVISRDGEEIYRLDLPNFVGNQLDIDFFRGESGGPAWRFDTKGNINFGGQSTDLLRFAAPPADRKLRMGVSLSDVGEDKVKAYGLRSGDGLVVVEVQEGLPAERAGVLAQDVIVRVDGKPATLERLRGVIEESEEGDEVIIEIIRDGDEREIVVELEEIEVPQAPRYWLNHDGAGGNRFEFEFDSEDMQEAMSRAKTLFHEKMHEHGVHANEEAGRIHQLILEKLHDIELDDETKHEVHEALHQALKSLENLEIDYLQFPEIHIGRGGDDERILIVPEPGEHVKEEIILREEAPEARNSDLQNRLNRMEDRMSRIERLLEKLIEDNN